jgi:hypothetical protein
MSRGGPRWSRTRTGSSTEGWVPGGQVLATWMPGRELVDAHVTWGLLHDQLLSTCICLPFGAVLAPGAL